MKLAQLVQLSDKREFCEEVDELENLYKKSSGFVPAELSRILSQPSTSLDDPSKDPITRLIIEGVGSTLKNGISNNENDLLDREKIYGHNRKESVIPATFCELLWDALQDMTLKILIVAAIVSIAVEVGTADTESKRSIAWIEGFAILVAVFVCSTVSAANDYKKEKQF